MTTLATIGVAADRRMLDPHPSHVAGEKYLRAVVVGAGGLPLILPSMPALRSIPDAALDALDGLLLTGSYSNVEPQHYGDERRAARR